jgi:predicted 3-demethylubiquinone-9 3-methyltransferase (glyoxalase superfamily)
MNNKMYPCLWFDGKTGEAARFYSKSFDDTKIIAENDLVVTLESAGQKLMLLNGGPQFTINPSVSFFVVCETEQELDKTWNGLLEGGSVLMPLDKYPWSDKYGWLQDKYGVSWQLSFGKQQDVGQKFTPAIMFTGTQQGRAADAVHYYTSVFPHSKIVGILKYANEDDEVAGTVKHAQFSLNDYVFMAMDSSYPHGFGFSEAISFVVNCDTQEEIDYYWNKLSAVPEAEQCGWLKDQYGISWQIIPTILEELMSDPERSQRVVDAFMQMKKFDIEKLKNA